MSKGFRFQFPQEIHLFRLGISLLAGLVNPVLVNAVFAENVEKHIIDNYNVVWETPSQDPWDSMPMGNGEVGMNLWVEEGGDLMLYLARGDSWSENGRLLKLARLRVHLDPNPFGKGQPFRQELKLRQGEAVITAGGGNKEVSLRVWVDAHRPVVNAEIDGKSDVDVTVDLETWRNEVEHLSEWKHRNGEIRRENVSDFFKVGKQEQPFTIPYKTIVSPDIVENGLKDRILWYHYNEKSAWSINMSLQSLDGYMKNMTDPLLDRIFGGMITGPGFISTNPKTLKSIKPKKRHNFSIYAMTAHPSLADEWTSRIQNLKQQSEQIDLEQRRAAHQRWWNQFWNRSWIYATGNEDADSVTTGYLLQRYMSAIAGRGTHPIKFNGSLFTVNDPEEGGDDPDYRRWGPGYWAQNTRLVYWPMLASGDWDMMNPYFDMFIDSLDLAKHRTQLYFGHEGAFYPETMYFWGTYANDHYGWNRKGKPISYVSVPQIALLWQGALETTAMMLDYYNYTEDKTFATEKLVPFAEAILDFYDQHYSRDTEGILQITPAQALETWHDCLNPMPEVAGLTHIIPRLIALPDSIVNPDLKAKWIRFSDAIPAIPIRTSSQRVVDRRGQESVFTLVGGLPALAPAQEYADKWNVEDPELYAVWPYRIFGVGKPGIDLAIRAVQNRMGRQATGWCQVDIQMALLGMTQEAKNAVVNRSKLKFNKSRFPAMWQPNADWIPDQDHGSVLVEALRSMIMQCDNGKIQLMPAWPNDWDADFKLHAPRNTIIEGRVKNGVLEEVNVSPSSRKKDLVVIFQ